MPDAPSTPSEVPDAHEGVRYANPTSKSLDAPAAKTDRAGTQRLVWRLFFALLLCVIVGGVVLGLVTRNP